MTWKIPWSEIQLTSDRTGGATNRNGTAGGGKFGSRLSIGRMSIAVSFLYSIILLSTLELFALSHPRHTRLRAIRATCRPKVRETCSRSSSSFKQRRTR